jgi:hypothetical protein
VPGIPRGVGLPPAERALQNPNNSGLANALMHFETEAPQVFRHNIGGAVLFIPKLGVGVDIATNRGDLGLRGKNAVY